MSDPEKIESSTDPVNNKIDAGSEGHTSSMEILAASTEPTKIGRDALVWGEIDPAILEKTITLSLGENGDQKYNWKNTTGTVETLIKGIFSKHSEGTKKGGCYTQGECAGGRRTADAMIALHILGIDIDNGMPRERVCDAILDAKLFAIVYTTYSNGSPVTAIKKETLINWLKKTKADHEEPTLADAVGYLLTEKRFEPWVVEGAKLLPEAMNGANGWSVFLEHQPIDKTRVVLLLDKPYRINERHTSPKAGQAEWSARYRSVCTKLGIPFDESCKDVSRYFFGARHKPGTDDHRINIFPGKMLDIEQYEPLTEPNGDNQFADAAASLGASHTSNVHVGADTDLVLLRHAKGLRFGDLYADHAYRSKTADGGFVAGACPFDDDHSDAGNPDDYGFWVKNADADGGKGWNCGCHHDTCKRKHNGDRLPFARKFIADNGIGADDLRQYVDLEEGERWCLDPPTQGLSEETTAQQQPETDKKADDLPEVGELIAEIEKRHAQVTYGKLAMIMREDYRKGYAPRFITPSAFRATNIAKQRTMIETEKGEKKKTMVGSVWLASDFAREYDEIVFEPPGTRRKTIPADAFNAWNGFPIEGVKGNWEDFNLFIKEVMCYNDKTLLNWWLTWAAHIFQIPGQLPGSAILHWGKERGTGKSFVFDQLRYALGPLAHVVYDPKHFTGAFNNKSGGKLLMQCEEVVRQSGTDDSKIKHMITSSDGVLEGKGLDAIDYSMFQRLALTSNEARPIHVAETAERRFFPLHANPKYRGCIDLFETLDLLMREKGGTQAMIYDLEHWVPEEHDAPNALGGKMTWNKLRTPPETEALREIVRGGMDWGAQFALELVADGHIGDPVGGPDMVTGDHDPVTYPVSLYRGKAPDWAQKPTNIPQKIFEETFHWYMEQKGGPSHAAKFGTPTELERVCTTFLGGKLSSSSVPRMAAGATDKTRGRCWVLPTWADLMNLHHDRGWVTQKQDESAEADDDDE